MKELASTAREIFNLIAETRKPFLLDPIEISVMENLFTMTVDHAVDKKSVNKTYAVALAALKRKYAFLDYYFKMGAKIDYFALVGLYFNKQTNTIYFATGLSELKNRSERVKFAKILIENNDITILKDFVMMYPDIVKIINKPPKNITRS